MRPLRSLCVAVLLTGLVVTGPACSGFSSDDPAVPDSTLARVLVELHVLSARPTEGLQAPDSLRDSIFAHYDVRPQDFDATLDYYSRRPDAYEDLYDTVVDSLRALQADLRQFNREDNPALLPDSTASKLPPKAKKMTWERITNQ